MMIELIEQKNTVQEISNRGFDDCGQHAFELLLQMLRNYYATGRYVVIELGFCILRGISELKKRGNFATILAGIGFWEKN